MGSPGHGHLLLLHRLQQRRLGLGRGAVDFIRQQQVAKDGARLKTQFLAAAAIDEHLGAHDVGRQQVGRELDPRELQVQRQPPPAPSIHTLHHHSSIISAPRFDDLPPHDKLGDLRTNAVERFDEPLDRVCVRCNGGHGCESPCAVLRRRPRE